MRSIAKLLGVEIAVPDFSTLSRRSNGLILRPRLRDNSQAPIALVVDSIGLKIFGKGRWLEEKHKTKAKRKSWRKLHLGLDRISCHIVCIDLITDEIGEEAKRNPPKSPGAAFVAYCNKQSSMR